MTNKGKNKGNKPYVEIRREKRRRVKVAVRIQLAVQEGAFEEIAERAGVKLHTVYKVLNPNQALYSDKVMKAALSYIKERNEREGIPQPEIELPCM